LFLLVYYVQRLVRLGTLIAIVWRRVYKRTGSVTIQTGLACANSSESRLFSGL